MMVDSRRYVGIPLRWMCLACCVCWAVGLLVLLPAAAGATAVAYKLPGVYSFQVPSDVSAVTISATGGSGGTFDDPLDINCHSAQRPPGKGGFEQATFAATPGQTLSITVAGKGGDGSGGTGGQGGFGGGDGRGGAGGTGGRQGGSGSLYGGGGGGGASTVQVKVGPTLLVAGGGGGCGVDLRGGNDGSPGASQAQGFAGGGGAGTLSGVGAGGTGWARGGSGNLGYGGQGARWPPGAVPDGGGGGGGGAAAGGPGAGGGGGSDFVAAGASNVVSHRGSNTGDGSVTITYTTSSGQQTQQQVDSTATQTQTEVQKVLNESVDSTVKDIPAMFDATSPGTVVDTIAEGPGGSGYPLLVFDGRARGGGSSVLVFDGAGSSVVFGNGGGGGSGGCPVRCRTSAAVRHVMFRQR
jgi:hypothetical protein